jgi:branched-chain amino acid transport system ATP-binding protein
MTVLAVSGLSKAFGGLKAVDKVDFGLDAGELLAMIGPNGAGKSTCFNMLNGQLRPDGGSIRFRDRELVGLKPRRVWRLGVGRTFQITATFASMTVAENVQVALLSHRERLGDLWRPAAGQYRPEALALLERVGPWQTNRPCC